MPNFLELSIIKYLLEKFIDFEIKHVHNYHNGDYVGSVITISNNPKHPDIVDLLKKEDYQYEVQTGGYIQHPTSIKVFPAQIVVWII